MGAQYWNETKGGDEKTSKQASKGIYQQANQAFGSSPSVCLPSSSSNCCLSAYCACCAYPSPAYLSVTASPRWLPV